MKTWIPDNRVFAYLNWKQVDALPRESTLLILPTAAIEQHGPHMPLATDTLINNILLFLLLLLWPTTKHGKNIVLGRHRSACDASRSSAGRICYGGGDMRGGVRSSLGDGLRRVRQGL